MAKDNRAQVIVIGAGLSGLTAASELNRQGIDVLVLEASPKVGGRVHSATTKLGSHLDLGGQWIGRGHHRLTALVDKARGTKYHTFSNGLPNIVRDGRTVSLFSPSVLLAFACLILLELASRIYVPLSWIEISIDQAIATFVPLEVARQLLRLIATISSTAELSMFSIYSYAKSLPLSGGLWTMLQTQGGAQDSLVVESMGIITSMLAKELPGKVFTDMQVTSVSQIDSDQVSICTSSGERYYAKKVIITVPPPMLKGITFDPRCPPTA